MKTLEKTISTKILSMMQKEKIVLEKNLLSNLKEFFFKKGITIEVKRDSFLKKYEYGYTYKVKDGTETGEWRGGYLNYTQAVEAACVSILKWYKLIIKVI